MAGTILLWRCRDKIITNIACTFLKQPLYNKPQPPLSLLPQPYFFIPGDVSETIQFPLYHVHALAIVYYLQCLTKQLNVSYCMYPFACPTATNGARSFTADWNSSFCVWQITFLSSGRKMSRAKMSYLRLHQETSFGGSLRIHVS